MSDERKIIRVDHSQLTLWENCQLKEFFRYQLDGRGVQTTIPVSPLSPFLFGTLGHFALEVYEHPNTWHDADTALQALRAKWQEYVDLDTYRDTRRTQWANLLAQVLRAVERYFKFFDKIDSEYESIKPEVPFEIDLTPNNPKFAVIFYGKLDNLVKHIPTQKFRFKEYKFYAQMDENPEYLEWANQVSRYSIIGYFLFGNDWGGIDYRITRKVESPTLINFYQHIYKRTREQVKTATRLLVVQALQMQRLRELGPNFLVPANDDNPIKAANACLGCEYRRDLCSAFIEGEDWQSIKELNYKPRELYAEHSAEDEITKQYKEELEKKGMAF